MQWCHRDIENMICDPKPPRWIIFCGVRHQKIRLGNRPDKSPFAKTQWIRRFVNFWCLRSISCNIYRINQYIHVHTIWYYMVVPCKAGDVPGNKAVVVVVVGFSFCFFLWVLAECVRMSARGKGAFCGLRVVDYLNFFLMLCPLESSFLDAFLAPVPINDHQWAASKASWNEGGNFKLPAFSQRVSCWGSQCNLDASALVVGGVRGFWFSSICLPNLLLAFWCLCYAWKSCNVLCRFILFGVYARVIFSWNCSCPKGLLFSVCFERLSKTQCFLQACVLSPKAPFAAHN